MRDGGRQCSGGGARDRHGKAHRPKFLHAGPGFGGSCFPKDTRAFAATGRRWDAPQGLIEQVVAINEARKHAMAPRVVKAAQEGGLHGRRARHGFRAQYERYPRGAGARHHRGPSGSWADGQSARPGGDETAAKVLSRVDWYHSAYDAVRGAGVTVLITEWNGYRALDLKKVSELWAATYSSTCAMSLLQAMSRAPALSINRSGAAQHEI